MQLQTLPHHPMKKGHQKDHSLPNTPRVVLILSLTLVLITIACLYYFPLLTLPIISLSRTSPPPTTPSGPRAATTGPSDIRRPIKKCDIFTGEWVPNPHAPYYTNETCWAIHNHQNCMKYGRPDTDYLKWRWKPDGCEMPVFNPGQFLALVQGRSMAFVGDSVSRNQMQSLMCLLSRPSTSPSPTSGPPTWSGPRKPTRKARTLTGLFNLHLDEPDPVWTTQIASFDYVVLSAGHWFFRPLMFYESNNLVGCHYCLNPNVTDLSMYYGYRAAFRAAFNAVNSIKGFKGMTFLRTFAPAHFENGLWNEGGDCVRRKPFKSNETRLEGEAERVGKEKGVKFRLMDSTEAMLLRPGWAPKSIWKAGECDGV
ncbi:hypothetical protein QJS10_CPA08g01699 [Acorus calamus]|uniref:Trichome birefringence-like N-terminal domain-containing protein n=1 Tax=Acorus calamus TaxID=4465 RepID=A0AAV9EF18_ACOCL|nr:hypothetical protein QJS10_CPA08g01699 [Acorus calamus]